MPAYYARVVDSNNNELFVVNLATDEKVYSESIPEEGIIAIISEFYINGSRLEDNTLANMKTGEVTFKYTPFEWDGVD